MKYIIPFLFLAGCATLAPQAEVEVIADEPAPVAEPSIPISSLHLLVCKQPCPVTGVKKDDKGQPVLQYDKCFDEVIPAYFYEPKKEKMNAEKEAQQPSEAPKAGHGVPGAVEGEGDTDDAK